MTPYTCEALKITSLETAISICSDLSSQRWKRMEENKLISLPLPFQPKLSSTSNFRETFHEHSKGEFTLLVSAKMYKQYLETQQV